MLETAEGGKLRLPLHCNIVISCFFSKHFARLVGAPLVGALRKGTHKGCPYETCLVAAKGRAALLASTSGLHVPGYLRRFELYGFTATPSRGDYPAVSEPWT